MRDPIGRENYFIPIVVTALGVLWGDELRRAHRSV